MKNILVGVKAISNKTVKPEDSAIKVGSGLVDVFATPSLIAFCEQTSSTLLGTYLDDGEVSVGININIDHIAASKIGAEVRCESTITKVDGRKVVFDLIVTEKDKIIAKGTHVRCVVNKQKFIDRLN